jgi:2-C-methyl-D-erythritol 4-phosphate cytidylyltransferase
MIFSMTPTPNLISPTATIAAIIPAAGCGARTGLNHNKILAPLCEKPLLHWTLRVLLDFADAGSTPGGSSADCNWNLSQILVAARREEWNILSEIISELAPQSSCLITLVEGGATRQQSVANAAHAAGADFLLVHDAARPLLSANLIARVAAAAFETGAAIAAMPASDTVKIARPKHDSQSDLQSHPVIGSTPDRSGVWLAQTPQIFRRDLFLRALKHAQHDDFLGTDCASLLEYAGAEVALIEGEAENFKVTYAADLERAEAILKARRNALN